MTCLVCNAWVGSSDLFTGTRCYDQTRVVSKNKNRSKLDPTVCHPHGCVRNVPLRQWFLPLMASCLLAVPDLVLARDVTGLADVSGDGEPDLATFAEVDAGVLVTLYSGHDGVEFMQIPFLDGRYQGRALERVVLMPNTGQTALAVLASHFNGRHVVEVRDAFSGDFLARYRVLNRLWEVIDLAVIDDLNADGVLDDPAVAVLARLAGSGKILVQIIRLSDGAVIANQRFLNRLWEPLAIAAVLRPGMAPLLGILAVLPGSKKLIIESRVVSDGTLHGHIRPLNRFWDGLDLAALDDLNGDGELSDPAWLVLARNPGSGSNVVQTLRVSDGVVIGNAFVLNRLWEPVRLATSADLDGSERGELLISAFNPRANNRIIHLRDAASDATLDNIFIGVPVNTRLASLKISAGELDQIFQPPLTRYTATVSLLRPTIRVTAMPEDPAATISIGGVDVLPGEASQKISLNQGGNQIALMVTGADGVATRRYEIDVTRQLAASFAQRAYVKASNNEAHEFGHQGDEFGFGVVLDRDMMVVGAPEEDSAAVGVGGNQDDNSVEGSGAAYAFRRDPSGIWSQEAYVKASNTGVSDHFGTALALHGNTLAAGAPLEDGGTPGINGEQNDTNSNAGAVYLFQRSDLGEWGETHYIKASNPGDGFFSDAFGSAVALHGDTLVVGAPREASAASGINGDQADDSLVGAGAAYVFTRDGNGDWSQQAYVKASNPGGNDYQESGDFFGGAVAVYGDLMAVGAVGQDSEAQGINGEGGTSPVGGVGSGAVYVFTRDAADNWNEEAFIKSSNSDGAPFQPGSGDRFGIAVALYDNTLAVGAPGEDSSATGINGDEDDNSADNAGAVYIFVRQPSGTWVQQAYLKASNTEAGDGFGCCLALGQDTLAVAAPGEGSGATGVNGDQADNSTMGAGAVYLFTRDAGGTWMQSAYLKASNPDPADRLGVVTLSEDTLVIGTRWEDSAARGIDGDQADNNAPNAGAVYLFE